MIEILVVGSVALDDIDTPFGQARDALGGSAVYFSAAASAFASVGVVGVVGSDYPLDRLRALGVELLALLVVPAGETHAEAAATGVRVVEATRVAEELAKL